MAFLEKPALAVIVVLVASAYSAAAHAAPSLQQGLSMIRRKQVRTDVLLLRLKDDVPAPSSLVPGGPGGSQGFKPQADRKLEPVFRTRAVPSTRLSFRAAPGGSRAKLEKFYYLRFRKPLTGADAERELTDAFSRLDVQYAMFEPLFKDASYESEENELSDNGASMAWAETSLAALQPAASFESDQYYLAPAPRGIDARYAWTFPSGAGVGARLIDIEVGWNASHVEFEKPFFANAVNNANNAHGTAVWGEIAAKNDGKGVTGISPGVEFGTVGVNWDNAWDTWPMSVARAVDEAASKLRAGDVLLLEQHAPGPDNGAYAPAEWYPPVYEAIRAASDLGIIVVAAAGNGSSSLDGPAYEGAFDLRKKDSGAILVGAATSADGAAPRTRLGFSNFGARIDAFGYGEYVTTTGFGDLWRGSGPNEYYTRTFSGTSSAAPMVAGAVVAVSAIARQQGRVLMPAEIRAALRATGTPAAAGSTGIGKLPDLKALIGFLGLDRSQLRR